MKIISNRDNLNAYHKQSKRYDVDKDMYVNNADDDMVVISKDRFDDIYNSPDWIQEKNIDENEQLQNYQQLARYDDIVELIEEDKSHMTNFDNFQKNSNRFYGSIRDQIFAETARIISADDVYPENNDEIQEIDDIYSTRNPDVDKIISIAASKDKSYLDLISNKKERSQYDDFKMFDDINGEEPKKISKDEINTVPSQPKDFSSVGPNEEQKAKLDKIVEYHNVNEEVIVPNDSRNDFNKISPLNDMLEQKVSNMQSPANNTTSSTNHPSPAQSFNNPTPPPIIPSTPNAENQTKPASEQTVSPQVPPSIQKQPTPVVPMQPEPLKPINAGPTIRPYVKSTPVSNTTKPKYDKPKVSVEDTEYMKIKKMIDKYEKESKDVIASGVSSKINVSDSLKVNLYKKFYLDENDLFNVKLAQDKKMESILKEYEDALAQNKLYETQKKLDEMYASTNKVDEDKNAKEIENKLKATSDEAQKIKAENDELKQKIKNLEEKMKKNISVQKDLSIQKSKLELEVNKQKKQVEPELSPIVAKNENEKVEKNIIQEVISDEDYKVPPSMDPKRLNQIKNNTLKGINKIQDFDRDNEPLFSNKKTFNQSINTANKKPIKFSEKNLFSANDLSPNSTSNYEKILSENPTMSSLQKAINSKKEKLFQSFTQEFRMPSDAERQSAKQASQRIIEGLDDDYEIVSLKDATSKKKN